MTSEAPALRRAGRLQIAALALLSACLLGGGAPDADAQRPGETPPETAPAQPEAAKPQVPAPEARGKPSAAPRPAASAKPAAASAEVDRVLGAVQKHYDRVQDLRASFVQESNVASMGRKDVSNGTVVVKRPGRMRWEYTQPEPRVLTIDGETVKMYSPTEKQLQVAPLDPKTFSPTALTFLLGTGDLKESFAGAELIDRAGRNDVGLRLRPNSDASFESLELWLAPQEWTLRESIVVDLFGNRTSVRFSDVVENARVPEAAFKLEVPPGTETIDLR